MIRRLMPLGILALVLCVVAPAGGQDESNTPSARNARGLQHMIEALRAANDVRGLQRFGEHSLAQWVTSKNPMYYRSVLDVCVAMNSVLASEPGINHAVRDLALAALDAPGEKPAHNATRLLLFLHDDLDYSTGRLSGETWATKRRTRAERWTRVCRSVRDQNAATPKLAGRPRISFDSDFPGGDTGRDPARQKQHEEAVERNRRLHEAHRMKSDLEYLEEHVEADLVRYLTDAYSRPPYRTHELDNLLVGFGTTKDRKAIITDVNRREDAERERAAAVAKARARVGPGASGKSVQYSFDGTTFRDAPSRSTWRKARRSRSGRRSPARRAPGPGPRASGAKG